MHFITALFLLVGLYSGQALAQTEPPASTTDPAQAVFVMQDITNFWQAFDAWKAGKSGNPFANLYVLPASPGARLLLEKNGLANPDSLRNAVRRYQAKYEWARPTSLRIAEAVPQCRATYRVLQKLYPEAVFPPVYFAIGGFGVGGNSGPAGVLVGAEVNSPVAAATLVAHEIIHAQQHIPYKYHILLEQCLIEGSADFLGELISGRLLNKVPYDYAQGRERDLWEEFTKAQNLGENDSFANWLYGDERATGRPADLGYYIGYQITKAYYNRAADKQMAVREILNIADARQFLVRSGYGTQF